jgi:hypothetical protein
MPSVSPPLRFLLVALAGWIHQQQRDVIDYLQAENRVLREQLGPRRLRVVSHNSAELAGTFAARPPHRDSRRAGCPAITMLPEFRG